jgi:hypothetical protein
MNLETIISESKSEVRKRQPVTDALNADPQIARGILFDRLKQIDEDFDYPHFAFAIDKMKSQELITQDDGTILFFNSKKLLDSNEG